MRLLRRISAFLMAAALLWVLLPAAGASGVSGRNETTVLFTHDLHSHFLPQSTGEGGESGGYARLAAALDRERAVHPDALTLDAGDFSVGSLIQTLYTTQAPELRTMGAMGYDAATVGNHEFDHTGPGFAQMLRAAALSGDRVPQLVLANYKPAQDNPDRLDIQRAMAACGVRDYALLERGGVTYGIFGIMGRDSHDSAPASGFALGDPVENAQRCVDALRGQGAQFIICLSHSGTSSVEKLSEDEQLAKQVKGIDLIVSGHTHTTLEQPILAGDTYIVSSGSYCENLGSITLAWSEDGERELVEYKLIPIDETLPEDAGIAQLVDGWKNQVSSGYLARYGLGYDQVLTVSPFELETPQSGVQAGNALGELAADAFRWAVEQAEGEDYRPVIAVTADGVLRAPLPAGDLTTSMAFDVLSLGVGEDGTSGYPLVSVWLTGKELRAALEVDASVTPIMPAAQLYCSGVEYSFNTHRMFFNRVTKALVEEDGGFSEIEDERLYRVVTGLYSAQMLGTVKDKSMGLLSLEPKDEAGRPITDFSAHILRDGAGNELKEWYALAGYLESFGQEGLPARYARSDGRKAVSHSYNPIQLMQNLNWIGWCALLVLVLAAAAAVLLVRALVRRHRRRRYGGLRRRRWRGR